MTYADENELESDLDKELEQAVQHATSHQPESAKHYDREPTLHDQMTLLQDIQRTMQDRIASARLNLSADYERRKVEIGNHFAQRAHEAAAKLQREKQQELDNLRLQYERKAEDINQLEKRMP